MRSAAAGKARPSREAAAVTHLSTLRDAALNAQLTLRRLERAAAGVATRASTSARQPGAPSGHFPWLAWLRAAAAGGAVPLAKAHLGGGNPDLGLRDETLRLSARGVLLGAAALSADAARRLAAELLALRPAAWPEAAACAALRGVVQFVDEPEASAAAEASEPPPAAAAPDEPAAAPPPAARPRQGLQQTRGAFLLAQASTAAGSNAAGGAASAAPRRTAGTELAAVLRAAIVELLTEPLHALPCSRVLVFDDAAPLVDALCAQPRQDVHDALAVPDRVWSRLGASDGAMPGASLFLLSSGRL